MAKLSAHGKEIGRIEFLNYTKAYFEDGKILKNSGFGWKLHAKVKPGIDPVANYQDAKQKAEDYLAIRPAFREYKKAFHDIAGLSKRWKLAAAFDMLGDDIDGIWSECCDGYGDNIACDVEEIAELSRLRKAAAAEARMLKESVPA